MAQSISNPVDSSRGRARRRRFAFRAAGIGDQHDDSFIAEIHRKGIVFTDRGAAIAAGHNMCAGLDKGKTPTSLVLNVVRATDLSAHEAGYLLGASVASYCPQHKAVVGK